MRGFPIQGWRYLPWCHSSKSSINRFLLVTVFLWAKPCSLGLAYPNIPNWVKCPRTGRQRLAPVWQPISSVPSLAGAVRIAWVGHLVIWIHLVCAAFSNRKETLTGAWILFESGGPVLPNLGHNCTWICSSKLAKLWQNSTCHFYVSIFPSGKET